MNTKVIALASAIVAMTALASAAEAGGGVRLGFGGPLGTFVATPSHGGGGAAYQSPRARKKAPVVRAARKPEVVRAARKPEVVRAARKPEVVRAARKPEVMQAARKPDKASRVARSEPAPKLVKETTTASKSVTEEAATEEAAPPVTGSSALIQGSIPVQEQDGAATTEQAAPEVKAEAPSAEQTVTATATAPAEQETSGNCKKFIPAVGMTVSVGCPE